jgi:hypothetical protein
MESWEGWEAEIQQRLAELTNEHLSPKPVQKRPWVRFVWLWFGLPWA